jgi:hypothetical protein
MTATGLRNGWRERAHESLQGVSIEIQPCHKKRERRFRSETLYLPCSLLTKEAAS